MTTYFRQFKNLHPIPLYRERSSIIVNRKFTAWKFMNGQIFLKLQNFITANFPRYNTKSSQMIIQCILHLHMRTHDILTTMWTKLLKSTKGIINGIHSATRFIRISQFFAIFYLLTLQLRISPWYLLFGAVNVNTLLETTGTNGTDLTK